jgi:recombination protein RecA
LFGVGISALDILIDLAVNYDIIKKSGSWFSYKDNKIGQGSEKVKAFLKENQEIKEDIEKQVRKNLGFNNEKNEAEDNQKN